MQSSEYQIFPEVVFSSEWCLTLHNLYHGLRYGMFDSLGFCKRYLCTCILYLHWEHTPGWHICDQSQQVKLSRIAPSLNKRIYLKIRTEILFFAATHKTSLISVLGYKQVSHLKYFRTISDWIFKNFIIRNLSIFGKKYWNYYGCPVLKCELNGLRPQSTACLKS